MSAITLEGKLYILEQDRAFKGEEALRLFKHLMRQIAAKLLVISGRALRSIGEGRSKISSPAGQLLGCNCNSFARLCSGSQP